MSERSPWETAKCKHQLLPRNKARARRGKGELTEQSGGNASISCCLEMKHGQGGQEWTDGRSRSSSQRTLDITPRREKRLSEAKEHQAREEADFTWEHQPHSWQIWRSPDRWLSGVRRLLEAMWEDRKKRGVEEITEDKWPPFPASQIYLIHKKKNRPMHQLFTKSPNNENLPQLKKTFQKSLIIFVFSLSYRCLKCWLNPSVLTKEISKILWIGYNFNIPKNQKQM